MKLPECDFARLTGWLWYWGLEEYFMVACPHVGVVGLQQHTLQEVKVKVVLKALKVETHRLNSCDETQRHGATDNI